ncbi:MAG: cation transporter [Chloroflexi bacterium]|nr:cation transporter [Chloroflexota bacterium]MBP7044214.1 cation transporter [Chloroflexota bacterium]
MEDRKNLTRFAWLSIGTAVLTISLKALAYLLTGSVGLLSDALESGVNLVAAIMALVALTIAAQPPDDQHAYGHAKAEYFSSGAEGTMILFAAVMIAATAVPRLLAPQPLEKVGLGLVVSVTAGLLNLGTALILLRAGKAHNSITLTADAHHLLSDVWTSVGVVVGVGAVALTGWEILDPMIALVVAVQILYSGVKLVRKSMSGLMDTALPAEELAAVTAVLDTYCQEKQIEYHALRTRQSASQRFLSVHIQVPGDWTVMQGHTLVEELERDLRQALRPLSILTHLEPIEDPTSWEDIALNREA